MKKRIVVWIICILIAVSYIAIDEYKKNLPVEKEETTKTTATTQEETTTTATQKKKLKIYNDFANESLVKKKFSNTNLSSKYEIEFKSGIDNTDCILTKDLSLLNNNDEAFSISYTPLVIGMKNSDNLKKYKKNALLTSSKEIDNSVEDDISIDFKKIIDAVVNGDNWSIFGGDKKEIRIIIPKKNTIERNLFYDFLLVTINNGTYPTNDEELDLAKKTAKSFLSSSNCIEKENVVNELKKIGSINETDLYVLFEADFMNSDIWSQSKLDISLAYPNVTVVRHVYTQLSDDKKETFTGFCRELTTELNYRTSNNHSFIGDKHYNVQEDITFVEVPNDDSSSDSFYIFLLVLFLIVLVVVLATAYYYY